jgi:hypothetical protein
MKGLKNWNKGWYVLKKNKLNYHKTKSSQEVLGSIHVKTILEVRSSHDLTDVPAKSEGVSFPLLPSPSFIHSHFSHIVVLLRDCYPSTHLYYASSK